VPVLVHPYQAPSPRHTAVKKREKE